MLGDRCLIRPTRSVAAVLAAVLLGGCGSTPTEADNGGLPTVAMRSLVAELRWSMPGRDSNGYQPPTPEETEAMLEGIQAAAARQPEAEALLDAYGYDADMLIEESTGDTLIVVRERTPVARGWGTYVVNLSGGTAPVAVHVNHPIADINTHFVGADLFNACTCRWFLMAGTHRWANPDDESDMARSWTSVFQAMHEWLAPSLDQAISVHGFSRSAPRFDGSPIADSWVVLSNGHTSGGTAGIVASAQDLRSRFRAVDFVTGYYPEDPGYDRLTGAPNPQGIHSNDRFGHGRWIHVELSLEIRLSTFELETAVEVMAEWVGAHFRN